MPQELAYAAPALPSRRRSPRNCLQHTHSTTHSASTLRTKTASPSLPRRRAIDAADEHEKQASLLKATIRRLKKKLEEKSEVILDLRTEMQHMKSDIERLEKESDKKDEMLEVAAQDVEQYRAWWLNEIQFMKLLLNKIPEPNRDIELVRASQAHYLGHY
ncbi:hypothetical protein BKA70DRAFT_1233752 [Coprinopsis sp. MPI-PUGE-AT-0042]|nr:hypothetical protein BKA70DRAFT_1233752 [Coprinopsis sp. MPI-PUGE-AT-0042]